MASFFQQVFTLLTTNPGNLVYHLLLTFSIAGALPASLSLWRDSGLPAGRRLIWGLSGLLALRLALFIASALAMNGILQTQTLIPLERAINLFSVALIIWLWAFPEPLRLADAATLLLGFLTLAYFVLALVWWGGQPATVHFNGSWPDLLGTVLSLGLLLMGGIILWRRAPEAWGLGLAMLVLLFLGNLAQLLLPVLDSDYPGFLRLAQMAAYPILLTLPQRFAPFPGANPSPGTQAGANATIDPQFFQTSLATASQTNPETVYGGIARLLSQALSAKACLIAYPIEERDQLNIQYGYNRVTGAEIPGHVVEGPLASTICNALRRGRPLRLPASSTLDGLPGLDKDLGSNPIGPLLASPFGLAGKKSSKEPTYGAILLSPNGDQAWTANDQTLLTRWIEAFNPVLDHTQERLNLQTELANSMKELEALRQQVDQANREKGSLAARAETLQEQAEQERARSQGLAGLVSSQEAAMATIARLEEQIKELRAKPASTTPAESAQASEELRLTLQEVASLKAQLSESESQIQRLQKRPIDFNVPADQADVIASISQELRQPMSSIVGYTDLLLGESVGILGALQRKFLERVKASTERMGGLIDDLIQVSSAGNEKLNLTPECVDLNALIDEAVALTMSQLREKNILLRVDIPGQLPAITADKDALQQIFIHLLQNAGAASRVEGEISIRALLKKETGQPDYVLLQVADSGAGIPSEDLPRVFSRLYRADNTLIQGVGDTGVGLSIVKTLVEAHGGRIWVDSDLNKGTTFSILLPVSSAKAGVELANE